MNQSFRKQIGLGVLAAALVLSFGILTYAQTETAPASSNLTQGTAGITFPVPELGNCASKDACRTYCSDPANMQACVTFAKAHGLMNNEEASRAQKFAHTLQTSGGPGGCKSPEECRQFCSNLSNLDACTNFAKTQGFKDEHTAAAEKIQNYLKAGGQTPGSCTTKDDCQKYCSDFSHAKECYDFAQKAGLTQAQGGGQPGQAQGIPSGQFQKFLELAAQGKTPGACKNKDECETYCHDQSHFEECRNFAVQAGLVTADQAQKLQQSGGKGPGGCDSDTACRTFCADPTNRDACFKFAEEHGLIPEEQLHQAQEGMVRLRQGLESAPPEVVTCLQSTLSQDILNQVQAGTFVPGPEMGDKVKTCFERFGQKTDPGQAIKRLPPQVASCLKDKLGSVFDQIQSGQASTTPEMADTVRVCFQAAQFSVPPNASGAPSGMPPVRPNFGNIFHSAPPAITDCLKSQLGEEFNKFQSGAERPDSESEGKMKTCFQNFRPQEVRPREGGFPSNLQQNSGPSNAPGQPLAECLRKVTGSTDANTANLSASAREQVQKCLEQSRPNPENGSSDGNNPARGEAPKLNLPSGVGDCVRSLVSPDAWSKLQTGLTNQLDSNTRNLIQNCLRQPSLGGNASTALPSGPNTLFGSRPQKEGGSESDGFRPPMNQNGSGTFPLRPTQPPAGFIQPQILNAPTAPLPTQPLPPPPAGTTAPPPGASLFDVFRPILGV